MINHLGEFCIQAENYELSCATTAHEKDGEQQFQISFLAWVRLSILEEHLLSHVPNLNTYNFTVIPLVVGGVTSFAAPFAEQYLNGKDQNIAVSALCKLVVALGEAGKAICQHANLMINTACCVSYVALIAWGHTAAGAIGLAGIVLIAIKRDGYLPYWLDQTLAPITLVASAVAEAQLITNPFIRGFLLLGKLSDGLDLMKRYEWTQKLLPERLLCPNPGKHDLSKKITITKDNAEKYTDSNQKLKVNISHIYNKAVSQVLPAGAEFDFNKVSALFDSIEKEFTQTYAAQYGMQLKENTLNELLDLAPGKVSAQNSEELFRYMLFEGGQANIKAFAHLLGDKKKEVEKVIADKGTLQNIMAIADKDLVESALRKSVHETVAEKLKAMLNGYAKMKAGVLYGTFEDELPPNFSLFRNLMKVQLEYILKKETPLNFMMKFQMLCDLGNSCSEGWLREVSLMLDLPANDPVWAVHHQLAFARGEIVNKKLPVINKDLNQWKFDLAKVGGVFNTHVINAVHCAVYPYFRTYEAEFYHQVHPREMLETLWILLMNKEANRNWGILDYLFMCHEIAHVHPVLGLYVLLFAKHLKALDKEYDADLIVRTVHNSIKPQIIDGNVVTHIQWDAISKWLDQVHERVPVMDDDGLYDPKWVERMEVNGTSHFCLTEAGVRLLLLDLAILEPETSTA